MTEPVALVMPCHNYARFVGEALRSVAAQTRLPDEFVVVDDGSTDDSAAVITAVLAELSERVPGARLLRQPHAGLAAAVDRGLAATSAALVAVVSADDRLDPDYVRQLAGALEAEPSAGFAYPRMQMFGDETGVCRTYPFDVDRLLFDHNYIPGTAMVRREAYRDAGGLRALVAHEDWDLFLSLAEHGWAGLLVPQVLYYWRRHPGARNHISTATRLRLRMQVLLAHRRLLARRAHVAVPWTVYAVGRRLLARVRPGHGSVRSPSAWVEVNL